MAGNIFTRSFTVPANTVILDAAGSPLNLAQMAFTATREGNTKSPAQKAALRDAATAVSALAGRKVTQSELQAATARVNRGLGRVHGGRTPKQGIPKHLAGFTLIEKNGAYEVWKRGGARGTIADAHSAASGFFAARNARASDTPKPMTARLAMHGMPDERSRYMRDMPETGKLWGSTATFLASDFALAFPTPEDLTFGADFKYDHDTTSGPGIDVATISEMSVFINTGDEQ